MSLILDYQSDINLKISDLVRLDLIEALELRSLSHRTCDKLSDGELQRVVIGITLSKKYDVLVLDEPCTFLDINQRMAIYRLIRDSPIPYKIVIEHDFTSLDYMADKVCLSYVVAGAFGNMTLPMTTADFVG